MRKSLKIGIVALNLVPGRTGGAEVYLHDLIEMISKLGKKNKYYVFIRAEHDKSIDVIGTHVHKILIKESIINKLVRRGLKVIGIKKNLIAKKIDAYDLDIVHFPLHVMLPEQLRGKKVITVVDIQQEYYPEFFDPKAIESRKATYRSAVEAADHIIAISDFTKQSLVDKYHTNPDKITTVHLAHDADLFGGVDSRKRIDLPSKYFYYPAGSWPHKNHKRLLQAYSRFLKLRASNRDVKLVLNGVIHSQESIIEEEMRELTLGNHVVQLGYINRLDKPQLFRRALAVVFPSLFEGFGIPVLEAMASKTPVLSANNTSLPEIVGDAGIYFDAMDVDDMAQAMDLVANSEEVRSDLVKKGVKRVKIFSNKKMALETIKVYERVANE